MQFTDGLWRDKEGWRVLWPKEIYDMEASGGKLLMYGPFIPVERRGNTLNNGLLTVEIEGVRQDVLRVRMSHHRGEKRRGPAFAVNWEKGCSSVEEQEDAFFVRSGGMAAWVRKDGKWGVDFFWKERRCTGTGRKSMAYIEDPDRRPFLREQLDLEAGENIYGLGERFTSFIKNGQSVDMWNADGGTDSQLSYKNIPFYISSRGYGIFVNHPEKVSFEVASEVVSKCQFSVPGEELEYYVIGGDTLKDVVCSYTALTGRAPLVPAWSFGLWLTTSFTTDYNEDVVLHFIDGMLKRDIPLSVFHFDCFWMKEFEWCNFKWDERTFKNPEAMLEKIHAGA